MLIGDNHLSARNVGEDKHSIDNLGASIGQYVPKGRSVMVKGLRSAQQVSSSSQGVHLL